MSELMWDGLDLMVMGMGTVFVFLALLVLATMLMSQILLRMPEANELDSSQIAAKRANNNDLTEVAAVAAAVSLMHKR
ncbi:OadG family protein [Reinekea sp.]|uniref:OadG family protein n=1 Tax=Reinekea sp. TaxID=1970455 RepID=UPI002A801739|nr:OadG family protein [Reinekea sp.]